MTCKVGLVRGDYVRCDARESPFTIEEPRESWRSLKTVMQIIKTPERH